MNLTQAGLERLGPEDLPKVQQLANQTKQGFEQLLEVLPQEKYPQARAYITNLAKDVTTFFKFWLEHKVWIPLTTNAVESSLRKNG
jgi:CHAD domain-containing protein